MEIQDANVEQFAAAMAKQHGKSLPLDGITTLTPEAAATLSKHPASFLSLSGLTSISAQAASELARFSGTLCLDGLTSLSDHAADSLAGHRGTLFLNGLTTLSDRAADLLATHEGTLFLNGLTTPSDEAANALAKHQSTLHLRGLTCLSHQAADALGQHSSLSASELKRQTGLVTEAPTESPRDRSLAQQSHLNYDGCPGWAKEPSAILRLLDPGPVGRWLVGLALLYSPFYWLSGDVTLWAFIPTLVCMIIGVAMMAAANHGG